MTVRESMQHTVESTKVASATAVGAMTAGAGTMFDWIPNDIGKLSSLLGAVLAFVLIVGHIRGQLRKERAGRSK